MTKVIILGQEPKKQKKLKPIEFVKQCSSYVWEDKYINPNEWENIVLITKNFTHEFDLMFAYDDENMPGGVLYLGHFNDGIV